MQMTGLSVNKMCEAGNKVYLEEEGGKIVNIASGAVIPIHREQGMYFIHMEVDQDLRCEFLSFSSPQS